MVSNQYNHIASFYDRLSWVLGKSYRESKLTFLEELEEGDKVLYLGGGTGGNLPGILDRIGESGKLFYIEASSKMIEKAIERVPSSYKPRITFLHQSGFSGIPLEVFDALLTQYFLDVLADKEIRLLFQAMNKRSDKNTKWIFVDFFETKGKKWLIGLMIRFFRMVTRNPRRNLPDYSHFFNQYGWETGQKKSWGKGFIQAWLMRKSIIGK
ncbi:MAG: class I SAM-dependent methyltransferase [Anditalea sp.]